MVEIKKVQKWDRNMLECEECLHLKGGSII